MVQIPQWAGEERNLGQIAFERDFKKLILGALRRKIVTTKVAATAKFS